MAIENAAGRATTTTATVTATATATTTTSEQYPVATVAAVDAVECGCNSHDLCCNYHDRNLLGSILDLDQLDTDPAEDPAVAAAAAIMEELAVAGSTALPPDNNDVNMDGVDAGQN
ncbi:hypothetical protein TGAM01_v211132 [Trichoderma gamsii]|uniref:Uncharacterized protein n=1 Tax=Trichoderma gamsii TaxID=398673 RepID=A0A2P4Z6U6_9HYPO|nr:hypothetical protein TGAM01_v211132 [Trichoderma gamsii]PON20004.1 hypothetical protein TGAM01_v211132 [Trichoderma gamsii]